MLVDNSSAETALMLLLQFVVAIYTVRRYSTLIICPIQNLNKTLQFFICESDISALLETLVVSQVGVVEEI